MARRCATTASTWRLIRGRRTSCLSRPPVDALRRGMARPGRRDLRPGADVAALPAGVLADPLFAQALLGGAGAAHGPAHPGVHDAAQHGEREQRPEPRRLAARRSGEPERRLAKHEAAERGVAAVEAKG